MKERGWYDSSGSEAKKWIADVVRSARTHNSAFQVLNRENGKLDGTECIYGTGRTACCSRGIRQ